MINEIFNILYLTFFLFFIVIAIGFFIGCIWAIAKRVERLLNRDLYKMKSKRKRS
jgi:hypothetical protein